MCSKGALSRTSLAGRKNQDIHASSPNLGRSMVIVITRP
jgi:hypothetical protein